MKASFAVAVAFWFSVGPLAAAEVGTLAANYLGVSVNTLRAWDSAGKLPAIRHPINGYRLYREGDLRAILQKLEMGEK